MVKNPPANTGDTVSVLGSGRSPGEGNSNPLQYSCLKNPMNDGAWQATVYGVTKSQTWLKDWGHILSFYLCLRHYQIFLVWLLHLHTPVHTFTYVRTGYSAKKCWWNLPEIRNQSTKKPISSISKTYSSPSPSFQSLLTSISCLCSL